MSARHRYRYYYAARPPGLGCQPTDFVQAEEWVPARCIETVEWRPVQCPETGNWMPEWYRHKSLYFGWVEYERKLTGEELWRYDLVKGEKRKVREESGCN